MGKIDDTLAKLAITLPAPPKPVASYIPFVRAGDLVFISGQLPFREGKLLAAGKVPTDITPDAAQAAARLAAINALAILKDACAGDLDHVLRIVRVGVFVASADDFTAQPAVANGASDLLVAVFGEAGRHARAAVGANTLPLGATVEVELIAQLRA